jgi:NTP pyrophosphatase (non-canonical NTP hydrolase)
MKLSEKEKEILLIIQEECAEVIQAISKVMRFGIDSEHPVTKITNKEHLEEELGDLLAVIGLISGTIVDEKEIMEAAEEKMEKLKKWSNIFN